MTHILRQSAVAFGARLFFGSLLVFGPAISFAEAVTTIVDSQGFESPFVSGPLAGQFSWAAAGGGSTSATVQNSIVHSGSQAVLVTRSPNSDKRFAVPGLTGTPSHRYVIVDWDMRVSQATTGGGFGPFFGVDSYDESGPLAQLGVFGVDASTGELLYQTPDLVAVPDTLVPFNTWHHYRMVFDFGTDTYQGYYDGVLQASAGFIDGGPGVDQFSDADIAAFAAGIDSISQGLTASAVFDNFRIINFQGDYNNDGVVNATDYTTWRTTFGNAVTPGSNADGNKNGVVDAGDYVIWRENQGLSLVGGAGSGATLSSVLVPEPAGLVLLLLAIPAFLFRTTRRRDG